MNTATPDAAAMLIQLSSLTSDQVRGSLEPWGRRDGADQGDPQTSGRILVSGHGMLAGVWECTPGGWETVDRPATEAMLFLQGRARITARGCDPIVFQAGDTLVLPQGWNGRWDVLETVRKFFVEVKSPQG